ncbi:hypothetical protein [Meiothermus sp. CFH 77666]|uniref:hypothetical protein n=1 Tax=Meiothermus sp. CFH 77666 TaxID=2817942 RepID=UPI001FB0E739|nr:hypothetical protein [Meiothermus sp. CFH 77666]
MLGWLIQKLRSLRWGLLPPRPPAPEHLHVYRFWLYLSHPNLLRPVLTPPTPLNVQTTLEIFLQLQDARPLRLAEVGFMRLRDRKALVLALPGLLWPGQTLSVQLKGIELASRFGWNETIAPYLRTTEGLIYYEQPFVFEAEALTVPVRPGPKPRSLRVEAPWPEPLPEPTLGAGRRA